MSSDMFFNTWAGLGRVAVIGALAYCAVILLLRVSGKRTLSKMNAFDLVVTVALGSTLASITLSKNVALAEGVAALAVLIGGQFVITWLSVRFPWFNALVKSEPTLLLYRGRFLPEGMRRARVVEEEVLAAVRTQGILSLDQVEAVVLETDGSFTAIRRSDAVDRSALENVEPRYSHAEARDASRGCPPAARRFRPASRTGQGTGAR
jgi:uncharacterized membrane protein YcaP (DUF421 family)